MNTAPTMQPGTRLRQVDQAAHAANRLAAIDRLVWRVVGLCLAVAPPLLAFVPVRPAPVVAPAAMATAAPEPAPAPPVLPGDGWAARSEPATR